MQSDAAKLVIDSEPLGWLDIMAMPGKNHVTTSRRAGSSEFTSYTNGSEGCLCARRLCRLLRKESSVSTGCLNCSTLLEQLRCFRCGFLHTLTKWSLWGKYLGKIIKLLLLILTRTKIKTNNPPVQSSEEPPASENVTLGAMT